MKKFLSLSVIFLITTNLIANSIEVDPAAPLDNYVSFGEWNTNGNLEGWLSYNLDNVAAYNGSITGTVSGADPQIQLNLAVGNRVKLDAGSIIEIRCKYDADASISNTVGVFYFYDYTLGAFHSANYTDLQIDGNYHVYRITLSSAIPATDRIRVDPLADGYEGKTVALDYIRMKLPQMIDPIDNSQKYFNYRVLAAWNTDDDYNNWVVVNMSPNQVSNGYLTATNNGDGQIYKQTINGLPSINLDNNNIVEVRMKRQTNDVGDADIFFGTTNYPGVAGTRQSRLWRDAIPRDGKFHIYRYDLSVFTSWFGALETMRFDPTWDVDREIVVDYIRVGRMADKEPNSFSLWQLPSQSDLQMLSYVLKTDKGKLIVIDGGYLSDGEELSDFLRAHGNHIDSWFLTHPHEDHIGALSWILTNKINITIDNIYEDSPSLSWIQTNEPVSVETTEIFQAALTNAGKTTIRMHSGDTFDIDDVHIEILNEFDPAITFNAVNNASIIIKVTDPSKSVLFLGDLGEVGGTNVLAKIDKNKLRVDYVQMAHHGQAGVGQSFYKTVLPKFCLYPTPLWLWNNDNGGGYDSGPWHTVEVRGWMQELNVRSNYVVGFSTSPMLIFAAENFAAEIPAIQEVDPASSLNSYVTIGEWDINDDFESWTSNNDISNFTVAGGNISGIVTGRNGEISLTLLNADKYINLSSGSVVEVRCRYNAGTSNSFGRWFINEGTWQLAFITNNISQPEDGYFHTYRATILTDLNGVESFTFNPYDQNTTNGTFAVDYIHIKSPIMINPTNAPGRNFVYTSLAEWNSDGDLDNWNVYNASDVTVSNGFLSAVCSGNGDSQIIKSDTDGLPALDLDTNSSKIVEFRVKRAPTSSDLDIFYATANNPGLSSDKKIKIQAVDMPQSNIFYTFRLDMSYENQWESTLKTFRLDPVSTTGITFKVDYIRIGEVTVPEPVTLGLVVLTGCLFRYKLLNSRPLKTTLK